MGENIIDHLQQIEEIGEKEKWWSDPEFQNRYIELYTMATTDGVLDAQSFNTLLYSDAEIGRALTKHGGRDVFNAKRDLLRDEVGYIEDANAHYQKFHQYVAGVTGQANADALSATIRLIADDLNSGVYGDRTSESAKETALSWIVAITDPHVSYQDSVPQNIKDSMLGIDRKFTNTKEDKIQELLDKWVPKHLHSNYTVSEEAGILRNNSNYAITFEEKLKDRRMSLYPIYDRNTSWSDLLDNKKTLINSIWGEDVSEINEDGTINRTIDTLMRLNNSNEEAAWLREEGMATGNKKVMDNFALTVGKAYTDNIITSQSFTEGGQ